MHRFINFDLPRSGTIYLPPFTVLREMLFLLTRPTGNEKKGYLSVTFCDTPYFLRQPSGSRSIPLASASGSANWASLDMSMPVIGELLSKCCCSDDDDSLAPPPLDVLACPH